MRRLPFLRLIVAGLLMVLTIALCFTALTPRHLEGTVLGSVQAIPQTGFSFDKDLSAWEGLIAEHWSYKDGALVGVAPQGLKFNTFLCSKKKYGDFELKFQVWLIGKKANSGVQIRSAIFDHRHFAVKGPQCDMGQIYWASLYGEHHGGKADKNGLEAGGMMRQASVDLVKKALKENDFNDYYIKCAGKHVTIKLNGQTTVDDDFPSMESEGIIAWQIHAGPPMIVVFRNIEFKESGK